MSFKILNCRLKTLRTHTQRPRTHAPEQLGLRPPHGSGSGCRGSIRYDTIAEFNVDSKAEYSA